jgi:hypothetical protein
MAEVTIRSSARFTGWVLAAVPIVAVVVAVIVLGVLAVWSGLFDDTTTSRTVGHPPGVPVEQSDDPAADEPTGTEDNAEGTTSAQETSTTNDLAPAQFAIAALTVTGALALIAGGGLALAEERVIEETTADGAGANDRVEMRNLAGTGASAVILAAGEAAKSLGSALRGLRTSGALVLMGGLLLLMGGVVAWQTIPGTDKSPTIEVNDGSTTSTTVAPCETTTTTTTTEAAAACEATTTTTGG